MVDQRYLKQRRAAWYFQLAVPSQLRRKLGKATIVASLKTRDLTVAQGRRWAKLIEAQRTFAEIGGQQFDAPIELEALLEIDDVARVEYRDSLVRMDADARAGARAWDVGDLDQTWDALSNCYLLGDFKPVAERLAGYCERKGIAAGSAIYNSLGNALINARMRAVAGRKDALAYKRPDPEPETFFDPAPIDPVTLQPVHARRKRGALAFSDVARRFIEEKQRDPAFKLTEQTRGQYEAAHRLFDQFARQPTLDEVDRSKASEFLDTVATFNPRWGRGPGVKKLSFAEIVTRYGNHRPGLANKTINRYAMALGMVWRHAEARDGYEGKNPWTGQMRPTTKRRGSSEVDKRAFAPSEIATVLMCGPDAELVVENAKAALPWLSLIGAYSGMRLNEICELDVEDVKETAGILFFDLTTSKTEAGVRVVPVHSKILEAGFRGYMAKVKAGALWPGLKPGGPDDKKSWYVSKAFTTYRRGFDLIDIDKVTGRDRLDFHSLRRSAITALKNAGIPEHDAAEVVGHEHEKITFGVYPDRHKLTRLQAIVEAITYPENE